MLINIYPYFKSFQGISKPSIQGLSQTLLQIGSLFGTTSVADMKLDSLNNGPNSLTDLSRRHDEILDLLLLGPGAIVDAPEASSHVARPFVLQICP